MIKMNLKTQRFISAGGFLLLGLLCWLNSSHNDNLVIHYYFSQLYFIFWNFWTLYNLMTIAILLISAGLFADRAYLSTVGSGLGAIAGLLITIQGLFMYIFVVITFVLILFETLSEKKTIIVSVIAAIAALAFTICFVVLCRNNGLLGTKGLFTFPFFGALTVFMPIISVFSVYISNGVFPAMAHLPITFPQKQNNAAVNNTIDTIAELKMLLDKGVITQEEFDTKKKELLGKKL